MATATRTTAPQAAPKAPPLAAYRAVNRLANRVNRLRWRLLPSSPALLELTATNLITVRCLGVAAELGIADQLASGPRPVSDLAQAVGADAAALRRILRHLSSHGIFTLNGDRAGLSRLAEALRSDHPQSMLGWVRYIHAPWHWEMWGDLLQSVQTGTDGYRARYGYNLFDWLSERPAESVIFDEAMTSVSRLVNPAIVAGYDFSSTGRLADVGGGYGATLAGILRQYPSVHGTLIDRPAVIERARRDGPLTGPDVRDRAAFAAGDLFSELPGGLDTYFFKWIMHDWNDAAARRILHVCREAMRPGARLLLAEMVIEPGKAPDASLVLDIAMLMLTGGKERTPDEFASLLADSGFALRRIVPTASPFSIVEGTAV